MSKTQLVVLWVGIGIIVLVHFFPPGEYSVWGNGVEYKFILNSPNISISRLFIQWAIVAVVTGGLIYTLKDKKKDRI